MSQDNRFVVTPVRRAGPAWLATWAPSHVTGFLGAFFGYFIFSAVAGRFAVNRDLYPDQSLILGFLGILLGWLLGVGALGHPIRWMFHLPTYDPAEVTDFPDMGWKRYFRWNTDHKVIGLQYMALTLTMLAEGGTIAMLMRANLFSPGSLLFTPAAYETAVTMHGMLMIATMFSLVTGIFGNYMVPLLVGANDMAFPRLNALSWHLLIVGVVIFDFIPFVGGVNTGWTFYSPLSDQTGRGADAFAFGVTIMLASSAVGLINMLTTILITRAPGMKLTRMPFFLWGIAATAVLTGVSGSAWEVDLIQIMLDRGWKTSFFLNAIPGPPPLYGSSAPISGGGNAYLYEVVFWFFGHPEVYILAIPGWALLMDLASVFARKQTYTYILGVIGLLGVMVISFLVWGHHLFVSGWQPQLRGYYMFTTETISIPTGFIFLVVIATIWRGRVWMRLPLAWVFAFLWTFVIGGTTGIYLSDVPLDIQLHGNYFVAGHLHYVILGSLLWAFFGAMYYWFPKMTGRYLNESIGWVHFWGTQLFFNFTFMMFFYMGLQGLPRRVATYAPIFDLPNRMASVFAFFLGAFMVLFLFNVIWSWAWGEIAPANPWGARTLEWQTPTPVPVHDWDRIPVVTGGPFDYGTPTDIPHDDLTQRSNTAGI